MAAGSLEELKTLIAGQPSESVAEEPEWTPGSVEEVRRLFPKPGILQRIRGLVSPDILGKPVPGAIPPQIPGEELALPEVPKPAVTPTVEAPKLYQDRRPPFTAEEGAALAAGGFAPPEVASGEAARRILEPRVLDLRKPSLDRVQSAEAAYKELVESLKPDRQALDADATRYKQLGEVLTRERQEIERDDARLSSIRNEIDARRAQYLQGMPPEIHKVDTAQVEEHNSLLRGLQKRSTTFNARIQEQNGMLQGIQKQSAAFKARVAGLPALEATYKKAVEDYKRATQAAAQPLIEEPTSGPLMRGLAGAMEAGRRALVEPPASMREKDILGGTAESVTKIITSPLIALMGGLVESGALTPRDAEEIGKLMMATLPASFGPEAAAARASFRMIRQAPEAAIRTAVARQSPWERVVSGMSEADQAGFIRLTDALQQTAARGATASERQAAAAGLERTLQKYGLTVEDIPAGSRVAPEPFTPAAEIPARVAPTPRPPPPVTEPPPAPPAPVAEPGRVAGAPPIAPESPQLSPIASIVERLDPEGILSDAELTKGVERELGRPLTIREYQEIAGTLEDEVADRDRYPEPPAATQVPVSRETPTPAHPASQPEPVARLSDTGERLRNLQSTDPVAFQAEIRGMRDTGPIVELRKVLPYGGSVYLRQEVAERYISLPHEFRLEHSFENWTEGILRGEKWGPEDFQGMPAPPAPRTEAGPSPPAKQPWEMTREEYVGPYQEPYSVRDIQEATQKATGVRKRFQGRTGPMVPPSISGEISRKIAQQEATAEEMRQAYRQYVDDYKRKGQEHREAIEVAVRKGLPVPASVLADYPDLARGAPAAPPPAYVPAIRTDPATGAQLVGEALIVPGAPTQFRVAQGEPTEVPAEQVRPLTERAGIAGPPGGVERRGVAPEDPAVRAEVERLKAENARLAGEVAPKPTILEQIRKPKAQIPPEKAPAETVGQNDHGQTVYQDPRGVRYIVENGIRSTQPVRITPRGAEIPSVDQLYADGHTEYLTREELEAKKPPIDYGAAEGYRELARRHFAENPKEPRPPMVGQKEYQEEWNRLKGQPAPTEPTPPAETPAIASPYEHADRLRNLAQVFGQSVRMGTLPRNARELRELAASILGVDPARLGQDPVAVDDVFDALEVALNSHLKNELDALPKDSSLAVRLGEADRIENLLGHRTRTLEISARQQFSTPLQISTAAAYALDVQPTDLVYEPTAGTGNLLAPLPPGTPIAANEIDPRRAEALRLQGHDPTQQDALRVPTTGSAVAMNPPWGKYTKGIYGPAIPQTWGTPVDWAERFVTNELRKMPEGGRLVAVMPTTILRDAPFFKWLRDEHTLRALVNSPPGAYTTRGTDVESVLLVVDKGRIPNAPEPVRSAPQTWEEYASAISPLSGGGTHARVGGVPAAPSRPAAGVPAGGVPARPATVTPRPAAAVPPGGPGAPIPQPLGEPGREPQAGGPGPRVEQPPRPGAGEPGAVVVAPGGPGEPTTPERGGPGIQPAPEPGQPALTAHGEQLRYSVVNRTDFDDASRSPVFAPSPLRSAPGTSPHPRLVVKTRSLAGARLPELTYQPKGKLLPDALARKSISDQQWDYGIIPALQANERGHAFLSAADVGVGKTRVAAGVMGEWLETGQANRILYVTASEVNIQDVKKELDAYAGGNWPFDVLDVKAYKDAKERPGKAEVQPLPLQDKTIYMIDRYNLAGFAKAIRQAGFDGVVGDEAHLYKNIADSSVGKAWLAIQKDILSRRGKFLYMTATPAVEFDDLEALIGLREWAPGGFADYKAKVTGQKAQEATTGQTVEDLKAELLRLQNQFEEVAKNAGWTVGDAWEFSRRSFPDPEQPFLRREERLDRYDQAVSAVRAKVIELGGTPTEVGTDAGEIGVTAQEGGRWGKKRGDVFTTFITPAEQEQIMRELAMKGKYDSVDLWRAGVEFEIKTNALTPEQGEEYRQLADFFKDLQNTWSKFRPFNKAARSFGIRSFLQMEAKRRMFDYRLGHAIEEGRKSLANGEQPVISTINVSAGGEETGPIPAAINQINDRLVEVDGETGAVITDEEIPEALIARAELLDRWRSFRQVPSPVQEVLNAFGKENVAVIIGDTPPKVREKQIQEFQDGRRKVALISGAGKTGISLHHVLETPQGARGRRHMIVVDYEWSATTFKQELGRVDRSGQVSAPKITPMSTGMAGERKFLATIANRMRNLGALSKGSAESASNDKLAEFELGGAIDTHAMRMAYRSLDPDIQEQFLSSAFRDPNDPNRNTRSLPQKAELRDFLLDLQFMHPDSADTAFTRFWEEREKAIQMQEEAQAETGEAARTKTYRGEVLRTTDLRPDLTLYEVKDENNHRFGILQGIITDHMINIAPHLGTGVTGRPIRRYVTFTTPQGQISGLEIQHGAIAPVSRRFGKTVTKRLDTPEAVLEAVGAGDRVALEGKAGYVLRQRRDGLVSIDGAKMADRSDLMAAGASYSPAGNFFHVKPENLGRFLERFPPKRQEVQAGAGGAAPPGQPPVAKATSGPRPDEPPPGSLASSLMGTPELRMIDEAIDKASQAVPALKEKLIGAWKTLLGESFPRHKMAGGNVVDRAAELMGSREYARRLSAAEMKAILQETGADPKQWGATATEANLRDVRRGAEEEGDADWASRVKTVIGSEEAPLKSQADYDQALADPAIREAVRLFNERLFPTIDSNYRVSQRIDPEDALPERGTDLGMRVNLLPTELRATEPRGVGRGGTGNTRIRRSPFAVRAKGTAESYDIDIRNIVDNSLFRSMEIANYHRYVNALVENGDAKVGKPGLSVLLKGQPTKAFDLKWYAYAIEGEAGPHAKIRLQKLYVRNGLIGEFRALTRLDDPLAGSMAGDIGNLGTQIAIAGPLDAEYHVKNLLTRIFFSPGIGHTPALEALRSVGMLPGNLSVVAYEFMREAFRSTSIEAMRADAEIAKIGAARPYLRKASPYNPLGIISKTLEIVDRTGRRMLYRAIMEHLPDTVDKSPTAVREFVNQMGQYNEAAKGPIMRILQRSGMSAFITAGKTMTVQAAKTITAPIFGPEVTGETIGQKTLLRLKVLSYLVGIIGIIPALNWLTTQSTFGRKGTPMFAWDTGKDDERGRPLVYDMLSFFGIRRGLRALGLHWIRGASGRTAAMNLDQASTDFINSFLHPIMGPAGRFGVIAASGYDPSLTSLSSARRVAPLAEPGGSQLLENLRAAGHALNPVGGSYLGLGQERTAAQTALGPFYPTPGEYPDIKHSPAADLAHNLVRRGQPTLTRREQERSRLMASLETAYRAGNRKAVLDAARRGQITFAEQGQIMQRSQGDRFTRDFRPLPLSAALQVWEAATADERRQLGSVMWNKVLNAQKNVLQWTPANRQKLRELGLIGGQGGARP